MTFIQIDAVTSDRLLITLFGGCLIGVGMGLCIRSGSVADGMKSLLCYYTKIGLNVSEVILAINSFFFYPLLGFFGISTALYSIVTYSAVKSLDYITNGIEHYTSLHIISAKVKKLNFNFE
jgi:uncharacterized membrane-anchored protein YitT (DUF2179 family)